MKDCPYCLKPRTMKLVATKTCPCRSKKDLDVYVHENYVLVTKQELKQIEDAIAFELGGEPCGLEAAHELVKKLLSE